MTCPMCGYTGCVEKSSIVAKIFEIKHRGQRYEGDDADLIVLDELEDLLKK